MRTKNLAPRGSGLGASSALLIAMLGALRALSPRPGADDPARLCQWAGAIEAKLLQVPTGLQDYFAALLGGPLAIRFSLAGPLPGPIEPANDFLAWFEESALLFFTGEPHFSGAPNWAVLRRYVTRRVFNAFVAPGARQLRWQSWCEVIVDTVVAIAMAILLQRLFYGAAATWAKAGGLTLALYAFTMARRYAMRRLFEAWDVRQEQVTLYTSAGLSR